MASLNYGTITKRNNPRSYTGGYKNVFIFAPRADFLSLSRPPDVAAVTGDLVTVPGAHTFTDPKGFFSWDTKTNTVEITGAPVGDDGAQEIEWTCKFTVLGDSASTQEQMQRIMNEDLVCLVKEAACLEDDSYVQLGDECVSPIIKVDFNSKTTKEGKKEYTVSIISKVKYFYAHVVTMNAE